MGDENVSIYEQGLLASNSNKNSLGKKKKGVQVNLVYVDMKQSVPDMYSKNPKFFFDPTKPSSETAAEISEILVNQKWKSLKMKPLMRDGIKSAKLYGVCGFKTYFQFSKNFIKDNWNGSQKNDEVRTDRVPLTCLLKDPSATCWSKSWWIGHEIEANIDEIAKKFNIKRREDIAITRSDEGSAELASSKENFQYGTYIEIEDRRRRIIFTIVKGIDTKVFDIKDIPEGLDTMYDILAYNDIPDRANVYSDYSFWKDQLYEVSRFRTMLINHAKKGVSKYKSFGTELSPEQLTALTSSQDTAVVNLKAGQDVLPLQHAQIDQSVFQAEAAVRGDIQIISKQAPRQVPGVDKTATEVKATEFAAQQISSENLEALEEVMASIAEKWVKLMHKNYKSEKVIKLTEMDEIAFANMKEKFNKDGQEIIQGSKKNPFLVITGEHLSEDVEAHVKAGSTLPDSDQARMQKLQGFAQFASTNPKMMAMIDEEELLKEGVEIFDVRNDNLLKHKDNPSGESKLLNAGAFIAAKMTEDHDKHLTIHERETNGNDQNVLHIAMHKEFKRQAEENAKAMPQPQSNVLNNMITGSSFMGAQGAPQGMPVGMPNQPMPQGMPGGLPPGGNIQ